MHIIAHKCYLHNIILGFHPHPQGQALKRSSLVKVRFNRTPFSLHRIKVSDSEEREPFSGSSLEAHQKH